MHIAQIRQVVIEAWTGAKMLRLEKYFSSTTNSTSDMIIRLGGLTGYSDAVREQLKKANFELSLEIQQMLKDNKVSVDTYNKVVTTVLERWRDAVRDEDSRPGPRNDQDKIRMHDSGAYWEPIDGEPKVILLNVFKVEETVSIPGKQLYNPATSSPKEDVRAKNIFLQSTFMREYIGRINLAEGKVENITLV